MTQHAAAPSWQFLCFGTLSVHEGVEWMDCSFGIILEALPLPCLPVLIKLLSQLYFIEQLNIHNIEIHFQGSNSKAYKTLMGKFGCKILFVIHDSNFFSQKQICIYISYRLPSVDTQLIQITFIFFNIILLPKFIPALS